VSRLGNSIRCGTRRWSVPAICVGLECDGAVIEPHALQRRSEQAIACRRHRCPNPPRRLSCYRSMFGIVRPSQ
jgi:hypothetical protein